MTCCRESACRRKQPILIRQGMWSEGWYAVTRWREEERNGKKLIEAREKHLLPPDSQLRIELGSSVLCDFQDHIKAQFESAADGSEAKGVYDALLDKLAELAQAKETQLVGPRNEQSKAG